MCLEGIEPPLIAHRATVLPLNHRHKMQGVDELNAFRRFWRPSRRRGARPKRSIAILFSFQSPLANCRFRLLQCCLSSSRNRQKEQTPCERYQGLARRRSTCLPCPSAGRKQSKNQQKSHPKLSLVWGGSVSSLCASSVGSHPLRADGREIIMGPIKTLPVGGSWAQTRTRH